MTRADVVPLPQLLGSVRKVLSGRSGLITQPWHPKVNEAIARLIADTDGALFNSVAQLGLVTGIEGEYLSRLVHADTGFTLRDWRRGLRVRAVVQRLIMSTEHVGQIVYDIGYRSHSGMDHEFRRTFGFDPSAFRRLYKSDSRR